MIILTIKTDNPEAQVGLYDDYKKLHLIKWQAHRELSDTIHLKIKEVLDFCDLGWSDVKGVVVYSGPGSFTGLRIGVSVANAIIYGLGCSGVGSGDKTWVKSGITKLLDGQNNAVVEVKYGSKVHITLPKR